jgi:hypothetical protein
MSPVTAVAMFAVTGTTALLALLGDRTHLQRNSRIRKAPEFD